jgi:hypothetical protein
VSHAAGREGLAGVGARIVPWRQLAIGIVNVSDRLTAPPARARRPEDFSRPPGSAPSRLTLTAKRARRLRSRPGPAPPPVGGYVTGHGDARLDPRQTDGDKAADSEGDRARAARVAAVDAGRSQRLAAHCGLDVVLRACVIEAAGLRPVIQLPYAARGTWLPEDVLGVH